MQFLEMGRKMYTNNTVSMVPTCHFFYFFYFSFQCKCLWKLGYFNLFQITIWNNQRDINIIEVKMEAYRVNQKVLVKEHSLGVYGHQRALKAQVESRALPARSHWDTWILFPPPPQSLQCPGHRSNSSLLFIWSSPNRTRERRALWRTSTSQFMSQGTSVTVATLPLCEWQPRPGGHRDQPCPPQQHPPNGTPPTQPTPQCGDGPGHCLHTEQARRTQSLGPT